GHDVGVLGGTALDPSRVDGGAIDRCLLARPGELPELLAREVLQDRSGPDCSRREDFHGAHAKSFLLKGASVIPEAQRPISSAIGFKASITKAMCSSRGVPSASAPP